MNLKRTYSIFDQQIEETYQKMERLLKRVGGSGEETSIAAEALEELSTTLEELHATSDELNTQNEVLVTSQTSLEAEQRRYRDLFEFAPDGYLVTDPNGVIQEANQAAAGLFQINADRLAGKPMAVFVSETERKGFRSLLRNFQAQPSDGPQIWNFKLRPRRNKAFPAELTVAAVYKEPGGATGLRWMVRDISARVKAEAELSEHRLHLEELVERRTEELTTANARLEAEIAERKKIEADLRSSEEKARKQAAELDAIISSLPGAVTIYNKKGRPIRMNKLSDDFPGYTQTEGETAIDAQIRTAAGEPLEFNSRPVQRALKGEMVKGEILEIQHGMEEPVWISSSASPIYKDGSLNGAVEVVTDITPIKAMEEELMRSEKKYRELVKYAPVGIYQLDFRTRKFTSVNDVVCEQTGYTREELLTMSPFDILDKESQAVFAERTHKWLAGEKPPENVEYRLITKDGREIYAVLNVTFTRDEQGAPLGATVVGYDITERKQFEEQLAYQALLLGQVNDGVLGADANLKITYWNQGMERIFGFSAVEALGHTPLELLQPAYEAGERERVFEELANTGQSNVELRTKHKDGHEIIVDLSSTRLTDADGKTSAYVVIYRDITARKRAEAEALRLQLAVQNEKDRLSTLVENISDEVWFADATGKFTLANPAALREFGIDIGSGLDVETFAAGLEVLRPDGSPRPLDEAPPLRALRGENVKNMEEIVRVPSSGELRYREVSATPVRNPNGETIGSVAVTRDITDRKKVEAALARSNARLTEVLDSIQDDFYVLDRDWKFLFASRSFTARIGKEPKDFIGNCLWEMFPKHIGTTLEENFRASMEKGEVRRFELGGRYTSAWYSMTSFPSAEGITILGTDITERKVAEHELAQARLEAEQRADELEAIMEAVPVGIMLSRDREGMIITGNRATHELLRVPLDEPNISKSAPDPEDRRSYKPVRNGEPLSADELPIQAAARGVEVRDWDCDLVFGNGDVAHVIANATPLYDENGEPRGAVAAFIDVTERQRAEEALRLSEARFRLALKNAPVTVASQDRNLRFQWAFNQRTVPVEQIVGRTDYDLFLTEDAEHLIGLKRQVLETGAEVREKLWITSGGKRVYLDLLLEPMRDNEGNVSGVGIATIDLTPIKKAEVELSHLNRTLKALSDINQSMVRATDEAGYMEEVCRIVVEDCGHAMVWIGLAEADEAKSVRPVASAGFEEGYLNTLKVTWADTQRGRGPTGTAIRTGQARICRNMLTDPAFEPWREEALKRGYAASVSLPLTSEGKVFGAITIYSREADPFSESEMNLLNELASDLAYGITMLRTRQAQEQAEKALKESEARFKQLADASFEGLVIHDNGLLLDLNMRISEIVGYEPEDLIGKQFWEYVDPKYHSIVKEMVQKGSTELYEVELIHKDGRRVPVETVGRPLLWKGKQVRVSALRDITERRRAEAALRESEARYRSLFNGMTEGFALHEIICDEKGEPIDYRFLDLNPAFEQLTGLKGKKVIGNTQSRVVPGDSSRWVEVYGKVALTGEPVHFDEYSPTLKRHYDIHAYRPAPGQFAVIFMDITERKRMEAELQNARIEAERRANELNTVFNSIMDGIIVYGPEGRAQQGNRVATEMLGFDPTDKTMGDVANRLSTTTMDGELLKLADAPTSRALSGKTVTGERYILHRPDKGDTIVLSSSAPLWAGKRIAGAVTVMQDVTEQYRAEETQAWLASFPEINPNPVTEIDENGQIQYMNPSSRLLFPGLESEGKAHPWLNGMEPCFAEIRQNTKKTVTREVQIGEVYYLQSVSIVPQNGRVRTYGFEITKRKQAEQALERSNERQALISNTVSQLLASPEPQQIVEELCRKVLDHLDCQVFVNYLVDEEAGRLHLNACAGIPAKAVRRMEWLDFGKRVCGRVAQSGERMVAEEIPTTRDPRTDLVRGFGVQAYACHPLMVQGKVIGTLSFGTRTRTHFSEDDLSLMKTITDHVAIAMGRYKAEQAVMQARDEMEQRVLERTQELRTANNQLRVERQRFNNVLDDLPAYLILLTPDYHVSFANRYFEERFGKSEGRRCYEYLFNRTEPCEICETYRTLKDNQPLQWEWTGPDQRDYDIHDFPFTDVDGSNLILEMGIDVTQRKQAEAELEKYRQHLEELVRERTTELAAERANLQKIFDVVNVGMMLIGEDGSVKRINDVIRQWTGREGDDLSSLQPGDALGCIRALSQPEGCGHTPDCATCRIRHAFESVLQTGKPEHGLEVNSSLRLARGETSRWFDISADPLEVDGQRNVILALNDITSRKEAEQALQQAHDELELRVEQRTEELSITNAQLVSEVTERKRAEAQLRLQTSAMEAAANGIIITDCDGTIQWCNPAFAEMSGYQPEEVIGLNPRILKSGNHNRAFYKKMWQTLLSGQVWHGEMTNKRKTGELYIEEEIITPVRDERNEISHFIAIKQDISLRKQAEEGLRLANAYNRSLLEASLDPLATITPEGKIGDVNSATEKMTGRSRRELVGTDFHGYFSDPAKARLAYQKVFETGSVHDYELEIRRKDGHNTPVLYNGSVYRDERGKVQGVFAVARDITDRKQFEVQLMQAEKHAVIGRMVGSVTHEINNPLQTIKNCLYLIAQDTPGDSPILEPLDMASSETTRLTDLVGQLRELYRPSTDVRDHPYELEDIIEEVHALLTPHLNNSNVKWNALTGLRRCYVNCVRDQILEVFLNISMNAIEAMKESGGTLTVDMAFKEEKVGVVFHDSGPGISEEILAHIFEPFMTTKSSGLGLGLSISYGIVQRHGGQIVVENSPEGGAVFTVWLPVGRNPKKENKNHATPR